MYLLRGFRAGYEPPDLGVFVVLGYMYLLRAKREKGTTYSFRRRLIEDPFSGAV